jgi:HlyD family secretion protein
MNAVTPVSKLAPAGPLPASRAKWFVLGGLLLVIALGAGAYYKNKASGEGVVVTTEKAITKTITQTVNATGKIQPEVEVKISPEVAGEIIELTVREGAPVKKGDLLVRIKPDTYRFQVEQQEANLVAAKATAVQARAQWEKVQEDFKRSKELFAIKLIADADFTAAKTSVEVAEANSDNALAQIRRTEGLLSQFRELSAKQAEAELAGLTDRERRMLALIAEGYTNRAIGEVLHLSEKTVRNHVSQLLRKLGFQRRSQAAAWAGERRLELPPE